MNDTTPWLTKALKKFDRLPLSVRFMLAFTPLVMAVAWMSFFNAGERYEATHRLEKLERHSVLAIEAGTLINQLQRERGLSTMLLENENAHALRRQLDNARQITDSHRTSLGVALSTPMPRGASSSYLADMRTLSHSLSGLANIRENIDSRATTPDTTEAWFTDHISHFNELIGQLPAMTEHNQIGRQLNAYFVLNRLKELLGQERLLIGRALINGELSESQQRQLAMLAGQQLNAVTGYLSQAGGDARYPELSLDSPATEFRDRLLSESDTQLLLGQVTPQQWFDWQTDRMQGVFDIEERLVVGIQTDIDGLLAKTRQELWRYVIISPLTLLACLTFAVMIFQQTQLRFLLSKAVFEHTHDRITVTDNRARIIEVNEAFTSNTGYTRPEVIGRNPNMLHVRPANTGILQADVADTEKHGHLAGRNLEPSKKRRVFCRTNHHQRHTQPPWQRGKLRVHFLGYHRPCRGTPAGTGVPRLP